MDAVINFFKEFSSMLPTIKVMDIVDILVVAFLIYKVIMMVRSTSAARIAKSVLIILILAGVTQLLNMYLLNYILDKILEIGLVALIVVFQPELRRMLEKLGSKNVREILSVKEEQREIDRVIEQTVQACEIMAKERTGVLIVFERSIPLLEYQKSGTVVDACVSSELLRNLFFTKASLHDGAVIIRNDRIAAAGCVLPLTENHNISSDLGTRHRAGIGISQNAGKYIPPLFIGQTALAAGQQPVLVDAGTHPAGLQVGGGVNAVLGQQNFQRRAGDGLGIQQVSPQ